MNDIDNLDAMFDDHPSLSASLEDFEHNENRSPTSPTFALPSQHSGFKSDESEVDVESSDGPWSPPGGSPAAWRRDSAIGGGWYRHQPYLQEHQSSKASASPSRSRNTSPQYESAREDEGETLQPANIPLPRGSMSPVKERSPSASPYPQKEEDDEQAFDNVEQSPASSVNPNNYFRFAMRAEVQQRTEPIEAALSWCRTYFNHISKSWTSMSSTMMVLAIALAFLRILTTTPVLPPVPDLVKVAGLAKSFEPLIFYSENGVAQIGDLQETGVAVWDLGESVRLANMTSTPLIVQELDSLSESLKGLANQLTKFFANVDGDIDGILIVMEWAKRELGALSSLPPSGLSSAFTNIHTLLSSLGVLENRSTGLPTWFGSAFTQVFGATSTQRTQQTLHRTFNEFLGVLEEAINAELTHSTSLFSVFESIDRQFLNLQRIVVRETDTQERLEGEFLSSMWVRVMGPNASLLRKYDKNKQLLSSVRAKTTQNKSLLVDHNQKLMVLKENLENLRRKLFSPMVRRRDGSTVGVEEQIRGLEGTYDHLRRVREKQRGRVLEVLYGAGSRRAILGREEGTEIEGK